MAAVALASLLTAAAFGLYSLLGTPELPGQPHAGRVQQDRLARASGGDIASRAEILRARLEDNPQDVEGWVLLGRAAFHLRRYAESAESYRKAMELGVEQPDLVAAYAEALTLAHGNKVPPAARLAFDQVLAARPDDPRARYYIGLSEAQAQQFDRALARWKALLADTPAEAGWRPMVVKGVRDMARFLKIDTATVLSDSDLGLAASVDPVAALTARLAADPKDWEAALALAQAQAEQGNPAAARAALDDISARFAKAPFIQQRIAETAQQLGLAESTAPRGPSDAQVAAAAGMNDSERSQMIAGMVAGLAERLDSAPDDLSGWLMLIRSYGVLGQPADAQSAADRALRHFAGNATAQAAIRQSTSDAGLTP